MTKRFAGLAPIVKAGTPYNLLTEIYSSSKAEGAPFRALDAAAVAAGRASWGELAGPRVRRTTDWLVLMESELDLRPRYGMGRARSAADVLCSRVGDLPFEPIATLIEDSLPDPDEQESVWSYLIPAHSDQRVVMLDLIERLFIKRHTTGGGVLRLDDGRMIVVARIEKGWRSRHQLEGAWHDNEEWRTANFVCSRKATVFDEDSFAALLSMMRETPANLRKFASRWETAVFGAGPINRDVGIGEAVIRARDRRRCLVQNAANGWSDPPPATPLTMEHAKAIAAFIDDHAGPKDRAEGRRLAWAFMGVFPWTMNRADLEWWNGSTRNRERPSSAELNRFDGLREFFPIRRPLF